MIKARIALAAAGVLFAAAAFASGPALAQQKLVLCTGHASPVEVLAIIEAARDAGCDRIVVTHAEFEVVNMTVEQMKKAGESVKQATKKTWECVVSLFTRC